MIDVKARLQALSQNEINMAVASPALYYGEEYSLYSSLKRLLDVLVSAIALVLFSPLMAIISFMIRLDSPGSALFAQRRVGRGAKEFTLLKFRSMHQGADESVHKTFAKRYIRGQCQADEKGCFKPKDDSRVTRVGRILRMTSLDELPQLWNILMGEMSLVGPRPAVPYEVEEYERWQMQRLAVVPGLTGLAQVSGRSGLAFSQIVRYDLEYIEERSLQLDLEILMMTVPAVLLGKAAG